MLTKIVRVEFLFELKHDLFSICFGHCVKIKHENKNFWAHVNLLQSATCQVSWVSNNLDSEITSEL